MHDHVIAFISFSTDGTAKLKHPELMKKASRIYSQRWGKGICCGNGILILGAARRLTTGKGIGIDIWTDNAGDSRPEAFRENAVIEGVIDRAKEFASKWLPAWKARLCRIHLFKESGEIDIEDRNRRIR